MLLDNISVKNPIFKNSFDDIWQFIVFLIVGGINTIFGYSIFALLIFLKLHYVIAVVISTILGVIFNFFTMRSFVFTADKSNTFIRFIILNIFLCITNIGIIKIMYFFCNNLYFNGAISIALLSIFSFMINKYYVFRKAE